MPRHSKIDPVNRIIDANINRVKEGLRVLEEITRFILDDRNLTAAFKDIRHRLDTIVKKLPPKTALLKERRSLADVGRRIYGNELKRKDVRDIFFANIQRVKESLRVLEEFSKLSVPAQAIKLKNLRYIIYEIEKETSGRL